MAAPPNTIQPPQATLIERTDIHKSCKSLESIVNLFNDYCQAADALAHVQKKLAKALREAVGYKATSQLAGDALTASAFLLESLAEVDAKFVKVADKECEMASTDLKKWFKKLAKEEKAHDGKVAAANTKIKHAGELFEKKAKKKDLGAAEAHSRYLELLSSVGPEMAEEKHNHTLSVTTNHTQTLITVALCIARTADAEWTRVCGCVRKFAPVIGRIGECRAFLEGGITSSMPHPDFAPPGRTDDDSRRGGPGVDEMGVVRTQQIRSSSGTGTEESSSTSQYPAYMTPATSTSSGGSSAPPTMSLASTPTTVSPTPLTPPPSSGTAATTLASSLPTRARQGTGGAPPSSYFPATLEKLNTDSVRSIESLSSFPSPPSHFPLPNMLSQPPQQQESIPMPSPAAAVENDSGKVTTPGAAPPSPQPQRPSTAQAREDGERDKDRDTIKPIRAPESPSVGIGHRRRDSWLAGAGEMGVQERKTSGSGGGGLEKTDSMLSTSGSIVASMRDRWVRGDASQNPSQQPREMPRVPNKVSDLASRYVSPENTGNGVNFPARNGSSPVPSSPTTLQARQKDGAAVSSASSSPITTPRQSLGGGGSGGASQGHGYSASLPVNSLHPSQTSQSSTSLTSLAPSQTLTATTPGHEPTPSEIDIHRRRKRVEELEDLDRREAAQALRAKERDVELRARELEKERERLYGKNTTNPSDAGQSQNQSRTEPKVGLDRKAGAGSIRAHPQGSYSLTNLNLREKERERDGGLHAARPRTQYGEPGQHAPYCGCQSCSASQYKASSTANLHGIQEGQGQKQPYSHVQVIPRPPKEGKEKKGGWMRRLSMPAVSAAFSSSSATSSHSSSIGTPGHGLGPGPGANLYGVGAGISGGGAMGWQGVERDASGGIGHVVSTSRPRKLSFGRR